MEGCQSLLLQDPNGCRCLSLVRKQLCGRELRSVVGEEVPWNDFFLVCNGRNILDGDVFCLSSLSVVHVVPRCRAGKGGFGSMLRALGSGIERTTNREACRDLSGRRMRDVNADKKLAEWVKTEADRERQREEERKQRQERRRAEPKHNFDSHSYLASVRESSDRTEDAVRGALRAQAPSSSVSSSQASSSSGACRKRAASPVDRKKKKKKKEKNSLDSFFDEDTSSSSSDDEEPAQLTGKEESSVATLPTGKEEVEEGTTTSQASGKEEKEECATETQTTTEDERTSASS